MLFQHLRPHISGSIAKMMSSRDCYMQLVPWTQAKENQEPDAPCTRLNIEGVNKVVFQDLKLSWDELDFIGIKKVHLLPQLPHHPDILIGQAFKEDHVFKM